MYYSLFRIGILFSNIIDYILFSNITGLQPAINDRKNNRKLKLQPVRFSGFRLINRLQSVCLLPNRFKALMRLR